MSLQYAFVVRYQNPQYKKCTMVLRVLRRFLLLPGPKNVPWCYVRYVTYVTPTVHFLGREAGFSYVTRRNTMVHFLGREGGSVGKIL